ncbi:hypothetical protein HPB48_024374 [Haemaphysalis longicornis]|uniref:Uncharacterized protein n=1 Tax=Haemaphysalis longicornis TaxID=44386 RepID=A0A9J6H7X9_HAELO|nr:hypothetical protein HPB48_024374 [Haemaphysalis longicornis]
MTWYDLSSFVDHREHLLEEAFGALTPDELNILTPVELQEPGDVEPPADAASRKRASLPADTDTEDTELYSAPRDGDSDDGFQLYLGKRGKSTLLTASSRSSTSTVKSMPRRLVHTILFVPEAKTNNLRMLNKQAVSAFLEATVPGEVKDVRIRSQGREEHRSALEVLRKITSLQNIKVRAPDTPYGDTTVGVIYEVDVSIPEKDLPILVKPADEGIVIRQVSCIGTSRCVKIIFKSDSLPAHVKVGHFRQPVRPYVAQTPSGPQVLKDWPRSCSLRERHWVLQMCWAPQD